MLKYSTGHSRDIYFKVQTNLYDNTMVAANN